MLKCYPWSFAIMRVYRISNHIVILGSVNYGYLICHFINMIMVIFVIFNYEGTLLYSSML
jgi:hypothetical protein